MLLDGVVIRPLTLHPYKVGMEPGLRRTRLASNYQARSAVVCSASRTSGDMHPVRLFRPILSTLHVNDSLQ